ncbi:MAG TPA: PPC domain-containing DNA-binding protein [Burkholderiales bacterium]|nr:PPC domain-containing DNA-binding protein [Burkholderiales bacterium]
MSRVASMPSFFGMGEDPMAGLARFAAEHKLSASSFTAIGAFSEALLGHFDWEKKDYERIPRADRGPRSRRRCHARRRWRLRDHLP